MTEAAKPVLTGGCQCGTIRYALTAVPLRVSLCHCRMCQKATGAPFASLAEVAKDCFAWSRGTPASFRSSNIADRDFCAGCGTPLSYRKIDGTTIEIMTGTFDHPDRVVPKLQFGTESRLGWVGTIAALKQDHASELWNGKAGRHRKPSASRPRLGHQTPRPAK